MADGDAGNDLTRTHPIEKVSTGVSGLDDVLGGGLPRGRPAVIAGAAGTGKTLLIYSYLRACHLRGESAVLVTFEEAPDDLRRHARTLGLDLSAMEDVDLLALIDATLPQGSDTQTRLDMERVFKDIAAACKRLDAQHFIVEGFDVFTLTLENPILERQEYYDLRLWSLGQGLTTLISAKASRDGDLIPERYGEFLTFWVDVVLYLDLQVAAHAAIRRLEIRKYRGSGFRPGRHMFSLSERGFRLAPVSALDLPCRLADERLSSGSSYLDAVLGGGLLPATITVLTGPSGAGKTTLGAMIGVAAIAREERVLQLHMETSANALFRFMKLTGFDLKAAEKAGWSKTVAVLPEAVDAEELLFDMIDLMRTFSPTLLIIESLSAAKRLGSWEVAMVFLVRLIYAARNENITILCTYHRPRGDLGSADADWASLTPMVDTIIDCGIGYRDGRMIRSLSVPKSSGSAHSRKVHGFEIDANGVHFLTEEADPGEEPRASRCR